MSPAIFNNPQIVAKGWYVACPSCRIGKKQIQSFDICGQRIALFRGEDNRVRALEAYCPHMGTDLASGMLSAIRPAAFFTIGLSMNLANAKIFRARLTFQQGPSYSPMPLRKSTDLFGSALKQHRPKVSLILMS